MSSTVVSTDCRGGSILNVQFIPETGCDDALFVLTGNDEVTATSFTMAQTVGYYLRSSNLNALASGLCASACTFALAGGVERGRSRTPASASTATRYLAKGRA